MERVNKIGQIKKGDRVLVVAKDDELRQTNKTMVGVIAEQEARLNENPPCVDDCEFNYKL